MATPARLPSGVTAGMAHGQHPGFRLEVTGLRALAGNFRAFDKALQSEVLKATRRAGGDVRDLAEQLCPVDKGNMKESIKTDFSEGGYRFAVFYDPAVFVRKRLPYYPPYVEFGTRFSGAQPTLIPAYRDVEPHYIADVSTAVRAAARRAA